MVLREVGNVSIGTDLIFINLDLHNIVTCTDRGGVSMKRRKWPRRRSELHNNNSIILTTNSCAGCDIACIPSPRPYHFPVHHARLLKLTRQEDRDKDLVDGLLDCNDSDHSKNCMGCVPSFQESLHRK